MRVRDVSWECVSSLEWASAVRHTLPALESLLAEWRKSERTRLPGTTRLYFHTNDLGSVFHVIQIHNHMCVCVAGVYWRAAALSALLQSVCVEHANFSESANHRLSLPQTGQTAQVYISQRVEFFTFADVLADVQSMSVVDQVSVRTVLCGWSRWCGTSNFPRSKKCFIARLKYHTSHLRYPLVLFLV